MTFKLRKYFADFLMPTKIYRVLLYFLYLTIPIIFSHQYSLKNESIIELVYKIIPMLLFVIGIISLGNRFYKNLQNILFVFVISSIIVLFNFLELISFYFQGESFNERFFFHLTSNIFWQGIRIFPAYFFCFIIYIFSVLVIDLFLIKKAGTHVFDYIKPRIFRLEYLLAIYVCCPSSLKNFWLTIPKHMSLYGGSNLEETMRELKGLNVEIMSLPPNQIKHLVQVSTPKSPRNLILVYLESLESSYFDEGRFPNLVPNLKRIKSQALEFTNLNQVPVTSWTMASIFASQCGMPVINHHYNNFIYEIFSQELLTCLGDVLNKAGYHQVFMGGASLSFAAKSIFFNSHLYNEIYGRNELVGKLEDKKYLNRWGIYDDSLFQFVLDKYDQLVKLDKPFNLTMLTLDTHPPKGYISSTCPKYENSQNPMLQAVHCTDYLFGKFYDELEKRDAFAQSDLVVLSDHLAMSNSAAGLYPPENERKLLMFALNSKAKGEVKTEGMLFDVGHTILDILDISSDAKMPLGESLLSNVKQDRFKIFTENKSKLLENYFSEIEKGNYPIKICQNWSIDSNNRWMKFLRSNKIKNFITPTGKNFNYNQDFVLIKASPDRMIEEITAIDRDSAITKLKNNPDASFLILKKRKNSTQDNKGNNPSNIWRWNFGKLSNVNFISGETDTIDEDVDFEGRCLAYYETEKIKIRSSEKTNSPDYLVTLTNLANSRLLLLD